MGLATNTSCSDILDIIALQEYGNDGLVTDRLRVGLDIALDRTVILLEI